MGDFLHDPSKATPILVVDDDAGVCLLLSEKLRQAGHVVVSLQTGREAISWLMSQPARLVLLDLRLADMDAAAVLDALAGAGRLPAFLVISGYADTRVAVEFMRRGALDYVIKDRNFLDLLPDVVAQALRAIEREAQLAQLRREILDISEREQRRIGQDLHDDLGQRLAAAKMRAHTLAFRLATSQPEIAAEVEEITKQLSEAVQVSRTLARGLAPVDLDVDGLPVALEHLAAHAERMFDMSVLVEVDPDIPRIRSGAATQWYRIAQECLSNAARHGQATSATIRLRHSGPSLILEVENDGKAFPEALEQEAQGLGLHIMRHRAESLGGSLDIDRNLHSPTICVRCTAPVSD